MTLTLPATVNVSDLLVAEPTAVLPKSMLVELAVRALLVEPPEFPVVTPPHPEITMGATNAIKRRKALRHKHKWPTRIPSLLELACCTDRKRRIQAGLKISHDGLNARRKLGCIADYGRLKVYESGHVLANSHLAKRPHVVRRLARLW